MPAAADEGVGPERRRLLELHGDGVRVDLLDRDVLVGAAGHRGRRRIARILPGEDDVVGGEGLAVVPGDALLQLPGHRLAVGGQRAVLAAGDRLGQDRPQVALGVPAGQRLVEQARAVLVLGADGEVRIEQGRALPPQDLEQAAAAALGRLVGRPRLRHRHARQGEKLIGQGRRQPHRRHTPHEGATRQSRPPSPGPIRPRKSRSSMDASHPDVEAVLSLTLLLSCKMRAKRMGTGPAAAVNGWRSRHPDRSRA